MQNDNVKLKNEIEAILFYLAEPVSVNFLAKTLDVKKEEILHTIGELGLSLESCGLRIVFHDDEVTMVTAPEHAELIEKILREERDRDLGRAGLETLTIIAYKGPVSRREIEYIRGVNCQFALRTLLLRGLIDKKPSETDARVMAYFITTDAIRHLGLSHISELPDYEEIRKEMETAALGDSHEFNEEEIDQSDQ